MANNLLYSITITGRDDTQPALRSALGGFRGFAQTATSVVSSPFRAMAASIRGVGRLGNFALGINLGLRPMVQQFDRLIDRGARAVVTQDAFGRSLGRLVRPEQVSLYANKIVDAASGTLKFVDAMALANRALSSGLQFDQLLTAVEFISKKAAVTGKDAGQAIDTVITGLARGSTLFLDDFGILVDGAEGVKRAFDSIHGAGAFDALGPAAQKAETVRQAIAEMALSTRKVGVSSNATVFAFQRIKNEIGNALDLMSMQVAKSQSLNHVLGRVKNVMAGITEFLRNPRNSIADVLFGKSGGKGMGLAGLAMGLGLDIADAIGRGIVGAITKALAKGASLIRDLLSEITGGLISEAPSPGGAVAGSWQTGMMQMLATTALASTERRFGMRPAARHWFKKHLGFDPGVWFGGDAGNFMGRRSEDEILDSLPLPPVGPGGAARIERGAARGSKKADIIDRVDQWANTVIAGIGFQNLRNQLAALEADFAPRGRKFGAGVVPALVDPNALGLTEKGERDRFLKLNLIERDLRRETVLAGRAARARAAEHVRAMRREGFDVDRDFVESELRKQMIEEARRPLEQERERIRNEIRVHRRRDAALRGKPEPADPFAPAGQNQQPAAGLAEQAKQVSDAARSINQKIATLVAKLDRVTGALVGEEQLLAQAQT